MFGWIRLFGLGPEQSSIKFARLFIFLVSKNGSGQPLSLLSVWWGCNWCFLPSESSRDVASFVS